MLRRTKSVLIMTITYRAMHRKIFCQKLH